MIWCWKYFGKCNSKLFKINMFLKWIKFPVYMIIFQMKRAIFFFQRRSFKKYEYFIEQNITQNQIEMKKNRVELVCDCMNRCFTEWDIFFALKISLTAIILLRKFNALKYIPRFNVMNMKSLLNVWRLC